MNTFDYKEELGYLLLPFKEIIENDEYFRDIRFEMMEQGNIEIKKSNVVLGKLKNTMGWLTGECEIEFASGKIKPRMIFFCLEDLKMYIKYLEENYQPDEMVYPFDTSEYWWLYYALKELKDNGEEFDFKKISYEQLVELSWNQNLSDTVIADLYGVGYKSVYNKRAKWNLQIRNMPLFNDLRNPSGDIERVLKSFPILKKCVTAKKKEVVSA